MIGEAGKTRIGKVRVVSRERNSHALRLSLSSLLSTMDMHPSGLPLTAILCIRQLRDPLPGKLRSQRNSIRPSHAWEQALQTALARLVAQAAYPVRGEVAADANAVIFTDHADLLACLASDWCQGKLTTHWWWSHLFQGRDVQSQLIPLWLEQSEYVPAALHHLAVRHEVIPFVRRLPEQTVHALLDSITYRFALPALRTAIFISTPAQSGYDYATTFQPAPVAPLQPAEHDVSEQKVHSSQVTNRASTMSDLLRLAPWQTWVTESTTLSGSELTIEQHLFLAIGLMLRRVPTVVRSVSFAFDVQHWCTLATHSVASDATSHRDASSPPVAHRPVTPLSDYTPMHNEDVDSNNPRNSTSLEATTPLDTKIAPETPSLVADVPSTPSSSHSDKPQHETPYSRNEGQQFEQIDRNMLASEDALTIPKQSEAVPPLKDMASIQISPTREVPVTLPDETLQASISTEPSLPTESSGQDETASSQREMAFPQDMKGTAFTSELSDSADTPRQETMADVTNMADAVHGEQEMPVELPLSTYPVADEYIIETAWGGIFYLINLSIFLGLYGDFTTPLKPGISLSIWDFLALIGDWLLGEQLRADPLWRLLVQLSGRQQDEPPGQHFEPPDDWRVPSKWLNAFAPDERDWEWEVSDNRLHIIHPEGFIVLDVPVESDISAQLARELGAYDAWQPVLSPISSPLLDKSPIVTGRIEAAHTPQVRRWLDWLMPYIYARLQRAFGVEDNPILLLCQHHARVRVTATHLDVLLSLATLPIEIRRSGLDRNAGWVPAAGRYVTFYFE